MRAWDRESFGPRESPNYGFPFVRSFESLRPLVVGFAVVDTIDEAVELANSSDYSLTASLWTRDVNRAMDVGSRLRAGKTFLGMFAP